MSLEKMGPVLPWWRVRMVWLVVGGPAVVVVGSFVLLGFAVHGGDTPLTESEKASPDALVPATQGRNHVLAAKR